MIYNEIYNLHLPLQYLKWLWLYWQSTTELIMIKHMIAHFKNDKNWWRWCDDDESYEEAEEQIDEEDMILFIIIIKYKMLRNPFYYRMMMIIMIL